jgi:hypothetical protein
MARRNLLRSWLTALLLAVSSAVGVLPSPAGAADPAVIVTVHPSSFEAPGGGSTVYARPNQEIRFVLADGVDAHHTVTIERADCSGGPARLCEQRFDDPDDSNGVQFRWSGEREYHFYDRYARDENRPEMTGKMVVTNAPAPVPPATTSTSSTTTTTGSVTTTTTTTTPSSVRPFLVPDGAPTTTTTVAKPAAAPLAAAPAASKDKAKEKDKGKAKAAGTETPTTAAPAPSDGSALDPIFDAASLTPGPTMVPDAPADPDSSDETAMAAASVASLLNPDKSDSGGGLLLMALGALGLCLLSGGVWAWHHRSSRYFPA